MANRYSNQFLKTQHTDARLIDCKFQVAVADSGGLGITGLVGAGIQSVYMHTSATPASGNPNPQAGNIIINFQDNWRGLYWSHADLESPNTGSAISISGSAVLTVGKVYVISSVGTSSQANWQAAGVPQGITPAVGVAFVAAITGGGTGTGQVMAVGASGVDAVEQCGHASPSLISYGTKTLGQGSGAYVILQCLLNGALTQPADGTTIRLGMLMSNSSILNNGD